MDNLRQAKLRSGSNHDQSSQQGQERASSTAVSWFPDGQEDNTQGAEHVQYRPVVDPADFFEPTPLNYYNSMPDLYSDSLGIPSVSYTQNDGESQLEHRTQGINTLDSPFQLRTPPSISQILGDFDATTGFEFDSQELNLSMPRRGSNNASDLKRENAQLRLEVADVKGSVAELQSE
jgi:hypothetical protein